MNRNIVITAVLCFAILTGCDNSQRSRAHKFQQMAEKINRNCPTRMSETIMLDSARYNAEANSISYFYSVSGVLDDADYMTTHYIAFKQALQEAIDNSVEMEEYRKANTSIHYIYHSDLNKEQLAEFSFNIH